MSELAERIAYRFQDLTIEAQVFSHRSYRHENPGEAGADNERLEFLGDAVLGFHISRLLFARYPDKREGELSRIRAHLVSAHHLAGKARELELGRHLRLGRGEEMSGGREKDSILADAYESLIAGIYLDGGIEAVGRFVEREFGAEMALVEGVFPLRDYKSHLQEELHARGRTEPEYGVIEESGPDHCKTFEVSVAIDGSEFARGTGPSKKAAQQEAARAALERLSELPRASDSSAG